MSLTTDNVRPSSSPDVWRISQITAAGAMMGVVSLLFCCAVLACVRHERFMSIGQLQSLTFVTIVSIKQATLYANRERRHFWSSRPSAWVVVSSLADVAIASTLVVTGTAMTALPLDMVLAVLGAAVIAVPVVDALKVVEYRYLKLQ